jgi:hypothetical protein
MIDERGVNGNMSKEKAIASNTPHRNSHKGEIDTKRKFTDTSKRKIGEGKSASVLHSKMSHPAYAPLEKFQRGSNIISKQLHLVRLLK